MISERRSQLESQPMAWSSAAGGAQAGGDWCESVVLAPFRYAVTIGDVCGHGHDVSATMAVLRACVLDGIRDSQGPSAVLGAANEIACSLAGGVIVTAIVAIVDERRGTLVIANAGHPPPLMVTATGHAFITPPVADLPLGVFYTERTAERILMLPAGALLVFYTDGITEHDRDPVCGELQLIAAARAVFERRDINAARAIARRMFATGRGADDAAAICVRTPSRDR